WQIVNGEVRKWKNNRLEKDFGNSPWGNTRVTAALEDDKTNLVIGTLGAGIFWMNADGQWQNISTNQGSSAYVLALCEDRDGNLWVGTDGNGLNRIRSKVFNSSAHLPAGAAQSLSPDADGGFWTAFNASGFSHLDENGAVQNYSVGKWSGASAILVTKQQQIFAGTPQEGLFQFQNGQFVPASGAQILGGEIFALFESRDGQIWAGTRRGLGNFDGENWKLFTTRDGLSENSVRAIAEDANGNILAGTESRGLNLFKDGKFSSVQTTNEVANDISFLYADKSGALWIGTAGHGLARLKDGKWKTISARDGLASDSVGYIFEDGDYFWIVSNAGLMRILKTSLNDFADGKINFISGRTFGKADGLPTRECSSGSQPAVCRTGDGRL